MVIEERNRLIESIQPYLLMLACKYSSKECAACEMLSAANMRLLKYIPSWDSATSSLATFARYHAVGAFLDYVRERRAILSKTSLAVREKRAPEIWSIENKIRDAKLGRTTDISLAQSLVDHAPSVQENLEMQERCDMLYSALRRLTRREKQAITILLDEDCTQAEAAARIGVNYSRVSQLRRAAIEKMRRCMKAAA